MNAHRKNSRAGIILSMLRFMFYSLSRQPFEAFGVVLICRCVDCVHPHESVHFSTAVDGIPLKLGVSVATDPCRITGKNLKIFLREALVLTRGLKKNDLTT
jgi:hypothetical protein